VYFSFSVIFSFLAIFQILQCTFPILQVFQWFHHFSSRRVDVSPFPWFSVISPYSSSCSVHFSFFTFFSDFFIFQVVKWMFLIFHDFQLSCNIPWPTVDNSKFSNFFSFPRHVSHPKVCISHFLWFSVFLPYSRSYSEHFSFSRFSVISSFFKSSSGCFSFSMILSFLAIFHVLQWILLNFPTSSVFLAEFHVLMCVFLMINIFSYLAIFQVLQCAFINFQVFQYFSSYFTT